MDNRDSNSSRASLKTRQWLESVIVGWNLCPFARKVLVGQSLRITVAHKNDAFDVLDVLDQELRVLVDSPRQEIETTLLVMPEWKVSFVDFNDFMAEANSLLRDRKLTGVVQLVLFHPDFYFAGSDPSAVENYTNRSPYPTIHLLREISVSEVNQHPEMLAGIPKRNIQFLKSLGLEMVQSEYKKLTEQ
jgi:uncharacterized protein